MSDKIKVHIIGQQKVSYDQIVEMTLEEYSALDAKIESNERKIRDRGYAEIEGWLDLRDVCDWDDFELDEFCIVND